MLHRLAPFVLAALAAGSASAQTTPGRRPAVADLTVERQAAQLIMPWLAGGYSAEDGNGLDQAFGWLDSLEVGGIVVSIGSPLDLAAKINVLQQRSRLPLLIAADLEGGSAFRFVGGTPFPTNMGVAATGREQDAFAMGRITGLEGRAVGVHLVFAPVADVNNNPDNPIINTRSFGADPARVAVLVGATVRGIQSTGMVATVKHFPGHGDTDVDSHTALPIVRQRWPELAARELLPFRMAVDAGVGAVMSAHIALPEIERDSSIPSTLSRRIMSGVLRDSLGFDGLAVTDALDMGALVSRFGAGELAVRALEAGADILLMPTDPRAAIAAVAAAVRSGRVSEARLAQSVERVLALKDRFGLFQHRTVSLGRVARVVGARASLDSARAVTERSLVLVRDTSGAIDALRRGPGRVAVVTFAEAGDGGFGSTLVTELRARGHQIAGVHRLIPASGPASYDSARAVLARAPVAHFAVSARTVTARGSISLPDAMAELVAGAERRGSAILTSFGTPDLLRQLPDLSSLLLAWTA
ncbi:MAG: glycoside hydrolase family 3 N-terminal domain-containing protein, partial [Gemmatimonadales bacterium]